jgi:hypothetical protein
MARIHIFCRSSNRHHGSAIDREAAPVLASDIKRESGVIAGSGVDATIRPQEKVVRRHDAAEQVIDLAAPSFRKS